MSQLIVIDNFLSGEMIVNNILSKVIARLKFMFLPLKWFIFKSHKKNCVRN